MEVTPTDRQKLVEIKSQLERTDLSAEERSELREEYSGITLAYVAADNLEE